MIRQTVFYLGILFLSFLISVPIILSFFHYGYFPTHDGEWAVIRLSDMYREIKDLQFPARVSGYLNFEYGYPLFNFAYPAPYYLGLIFVFLKLGFVGSIKILFTLSVIFSFFFMFLLSSSLWKNKLSGLVSSILYIYVPYRIIDLYVRGSLGESLSFVLFPLIFLGIKRIYEKEDLMGTLLTSVSFSFLIMTHNIMTVLFGILIGFVILGAFLRKKFNFIIKLLLSLIYSLCLSAFFWIPAIFEKKLILLSKIPIADRSLYFVKPLELIIPKWGYGVPTDANGFGYQIGIIQIIIFVLALVLVAKNYSKNKNKENKIGLFLVLSTFFISLLFFSFTSLIWSHTPLLSEINYPWTLLAIVMFLISLITGYVVKQNKIFMGITLVLAIAAIITYFPYARPQYFVDRGDSFYSTNQATTTSSNELMPLWTKTQPQKSPLQKVEVKYGKIGNLAFNSKKISFIANLSKSQIIRINTIYYPGWDLFVDGKSAKISYFNKLGVMDLYLSSGLHIVKGTFGETSLRFISDLISIAAISILLVVLVFDFLIKKR